MRVQFFNSCMQICGTLQDPHGLVKAYRAMAKSLERYKYTQTHTYIHI